MSKYTTQIRFICESLAGYSESTGLENIDDVLTKAIPKIFDFTFPMYDDAYKSVLERKILMHYYTREIGAETYALWKLWLRTKLNEIMPYYNELYKTTLIEFDPLFDVNYTKTFTGTKGGAYSHDKDNTGNQTNGTSRSVVYVAEDRNKNSFSDTPTTYITQIDDRSYLTNYTDTQIDELHNTNTQGTDTTNNEMNETLKSESTNTEDYIEKIVGSRGFQNYSKKIADLRKNIINIDMLIINELSDLFFGLW